MLSVQQVSLADKLRLAAGRGQTDTVLQLIEEGATFDTDREGRTAVHIASTNGHADTLTALLLAGANCTSSDVEGRTALQKASSEGHVDIVKLLLKHGCPVDHQDAMHGNTALHEASWKGYSQTAEILCKSRANMYIRNRAGFAPLHLTCQQGHNQSCRVLLLAGCRPDIKNTYGDTALHTSSRYGHAGVARILISARARVSEQNKNGDTALHIAAAMHRRKLSRILLESGCDSGVLNKQNETARDIAQRKDHTQVVNIIDNPPPLLAPPLVPIPEEPKKKTKSKKRDKDGSGTSSKDSAKSKQKLKKKVKKGMGSWSPYGCHYFPDLGEFPGPKLDSLPHDPLHKGEQYFLDLGGNIKKGPMGVGYTCYCAPFFQNVEAKLEKDKQEVIGHVDNAHAMLDAKISSLERRTRNQLFNLNHAVKERMAAERQECHERVDRRALQERSQLEHLYELRARHLRNEVKHLVKGEAVPERTSDSDASHASRTLKARASKSRANLQRSKSEECLSEYGYLEDLPPSMPALRSRDAETVYKGLSVGDRPQLKVKGLTGKSKDAEAAEETESSAESESEEEDVEEVELGVLDEPPRIEVRKEQLQSKNAVVSRTDVAVHSTDKSLKESSNLIVRTKKEGDSNLNSSVDSGHSEGMIINSEEPTYNYGAKPKYQFPGPRTFSYGVPNGYPPHLHVTQQVRRLVAENASEGSSSDTYETMRPQTVVHSRSGRPPLPPPKPTHYNYRPPVGKVVDQDDSGYGTRYYGSSSGPSPTASGSPDVAEGLEWERTAIFSQGRSSLV